MSILILVKIDSHMLKKKNKKKPKHHFCLTAGCFFFFFRLRKQQHLNERKEHTQAKKLIKNHQLTKLKCQIITGLHIWQTFSILVTGMPYEILM